MRSHREQLAEGWTNLIHLATTPGTVHTRRTWPSTSSYGRNGRREPTRRSTLSSPTGWLTLASRVSRRQAKAVIPVTAFWCSMAWAGERVALACVPGLEAERLVDSGNRPLRGGAGCRARWTARGLLRAARGPFRRLSRSSC